MALQVWLPLNGSIENQGLTNVAVSLQNGTPTFANDGKIGKCFYNSSSGSNITVPCDFLSEQLSITFWVKPNSPAAWMDLFSIGQYANRMETNDSNGSAYYLFTDDTSHAVAPQSTELFHIPNGIWSHVAYIIDGTNVKVYLNGELKKTISQISSLVDILGNNKYIYIGRRRTTESAYYQGYYNDFRIYDNALSDREIHEIAKGLVVHYPLNQYEKEANLCPNSYINETSSAYGFADRRVSLTAGKTYTLIVNGRVVDGDGGLATYIYNSNWSESNNRRITNKEDVTFSMPFTPKTTGTYHITSYSFLKQSTAGGNVHVNWYKLIEGSEYSGIWSPSSSDAINLESIEYDTSGFGNHGSISGAIKLSLDSPRNDCCYKFNNMNYISAKTPWGANAVSELTISLWINQISGGPYSTFLASNGYGGNGLWLGMNVEGSGQWAYRGSHSPHYARSGEGNISTNTWHHFVYKFKDGTVTWYRNGNKLASTKYDDSVLNLSNVIALGNSYNGNTWDTSFEGKISDFRLYATALSDKDIAELYNTPMCITNNGALMTQGEFKEV